MNTPSFNMTTNQGIIAKLFPVYQNNLSGEIRAALKRDFIQTDQMMIKLLWLHWLLAATATAFTYSTYLLGFVAGAVITLTATLIFKLQPGTALSRSVIATSFMLYSVLFIQQHLGRIEMHFHIFVTIAFLIRYKDILPVVVATVVVYFHHLGFSYAQSIDFTIGDMPLMVFSYGCGFDIVMLHAVFVIAELVVCSIIILDITRQFFLTVDMDEIIQRLTNTATDTELLALEIQKNSEEIAQGAEYQSESIEEIGTASKQISGSVNTNANISSEAAEMTSAISAKVDELADSMANMSETSKSISGIIKTIDTIAFQTNILSLNAAVEAARAGEAGKGFSVVADEVRDLAQKTTEAARFIASKIEETIQNAASSSKLTHLIQIQIQQMDQRVQELSVASKEQAVQVGDINEQLGVIEVITQQNAMSAEQNAESVKRLADAFKTLNDIADELRMRVSSLSKIEDIRSSLTYEELMSTTNWKADAESGIKTRQIGSLKQRQPSEVYQ